jgi:hypothetical protein
MEVCFQPGRRRVALFSELRRFTSAKKILVACATRKLVGNEDFSWGEFNEEISARKYYYVTRMKCRAF